MHLLHIVLVHVAHNLDAVSDYTQELAHPLLLPSVAPDMIRSAQAEIDLEAVHHVHPVAVVSDSEVDLSLVARIDSDPGHVVCFQIQKECRMVHSARTATWAAPEDSVVVRLGAVAAARFVAGSNCSGWSDPKLEWHKLTANRVSSA